MQSKLLRQEGEARTFLLVLDPGEEVISTLKDFAARNNLQGAHFQTIGAFQRITWLISSGSEILPRDPGE